MERKETHGCTDGRVNINAFAIAIVLGVAIVLWWLKLRDTYLRNKNSTTSSSNASYETNLNTCTTSPET